MLLYYKVLRLFQSLFHRLQRHVCLGFIPLELESRKLRAFFHLLSVCCMPGYAKIRKAELSMTWVSLEEPSAHRETGK